MEISHQVILLLECFVIQTAEDQGFAALQTGQETHSRPFQGRISALITGRIQKEFAF